MLELDADTRSIVDQVDRFATQELKSYREHPDSDMDHAALAGLVRAAEDMGLINGQAEADYGLWYGSGPQALRQSIAILRSLASVNGEATLHLHWEALSARALVEADAVLYDTTRPWLCLTGSTGWPAAALASWQRGCLDPAGRRRLQAWWEPDIDGMLLLSPGDGRMVLLPAIGDAGTVVWSCWHPSDFFGETATPLHAPSGWQGRRVRAAPDARRHDFACLDADRWGDLWSLAGTGLLAIGLGILDDLAVRARDHGRNRRQGGVAIQEHAAVQALMGEVSLARELGESMLDALARPSVEPLWYRTAGARAFLHPAFCRAANAAMQIHGGIGYMRDTGIEGGVRMQNTLRCLNGTPPDLQRWVTVWEQLA